MTKLTTERLDKLQDNLLQFQDAYSDPADKENYDIFVDALHMLDEFKAAKEKILAYEQAAEKPYGYLEPCDFPRTTATGYPEKDKYAFMPLYAAPVLPKQPELVENLKKVMNSWLAMEPKLAFQPEFTDVMMLLDAEAAPAKPVIPEQTERERIRREHAEWSDATFGNVGPVGPLKHLSKEALEAAAAPDDLLEWADMQFLLWDAQRRMGIPDDFITIAMAEKLEINKKRKWPKPKDGEPCLHINTQSSQPVSEPYKLAKSPEACAWISDGEGLWLGDCGLTWTFFDDGPNENGLKYCPSCGKKVSFIAAPAQESE